MKKITRHDGPFGRRNCCVREGGSRREKKWIARMRYEPRSRSIRGNAGFWSMRGYLAIRCEENGIDLPRPVKRKGDRSIRSR